MPARGFVQMAFQSNVSSTQIIHFLEIKGFKQGECADKSLLTYKDNFRFDGDVTCSLNLSDNGKQVLSFYPSGHPFANQDIFIKQLCLEMKNVLCGEGLGVISDLDQTAIEEMQGESEAQIFFHNSYSKFINQSVLSNALIQDTKDQRIPNFTNEKLLSLIEVNIVTNMEIYFRELWKYFLLDLKSLPNSIKDKKLERYQLENLLNEESDFEGMLASSFSFQNINNIEKNLAEVSKQKFQLKELLGELSRKFNRNFYKNMSSLFTSRHKIVHENEDIGMDANELKENLDDVIRAATKIYLSICENRNYRMFMLHESGMSFSVIRELIDS